MSMAVNFLTVGCSHISIPVYPSHVPISHMDSMSCSLISHTSAGLVVYYVGPSVAITVDEVIMSGKRFITRYVLIDNVHMKLTPLTGRLIDSNMLCSCFLVHSDELI